MCRLQVVAVIMGRMEKDEPHGSRGWDRNLHSARRHPRLYKGLTGFLAVAVVVNLAVLVTNAAAGQWGRVVGGAVVLGVVAVLLRFYLALVRQEPRRPTFGLGPRQN